MKASKGKSSGKDGGPSMSAPKVKGHVSKGSGDGSPSTQNPSKWSGGGRAAGSQKSDGGPYGDSPLSSSKKK